MIELVLQDRHERLVDQGRFAAAADSADADEASEREIYVNPVEIVAAGSPERKELAVAAPAGLRNRDVELAFEVVDSQGLA